VLSRHAHAALKMSSPLAVSARSAEIWYNERNLLKGDHEKARFLLHRLFFSVLLRVGQPILAGVAADGRACLPVGAFGLELPNRVSDAVHWRRGGLLCFGCWTLDGVRETAAYGSAEDA